MYSFLHVFLLLDTSWQYAKVVSAVDISVPNKKQLTKNENK